MGNLSQFNEECERQANTDALKELLDRTRRLESRMVQAMFGWIDKVQAELGITKREAAIKVLEACAADGTPLSAISTTFASRKRKSATSRRSSATRCRTWKWKRFPASCSATSTSR